MKVIFWLLIFLIFYAYLGYTLLVIILSLFLRQKITKADIKPKVSIIITAYNEERDIARKINNTLDLDYPSDLKEVIVASDGSTDETDDIVISYAPKNVILHRVEGRLGKTATQNSAVNISSGDILIFSDAASIYHQQAIKKIVRNYHDQRVGAVSGRYKYIDKSGGSVGKGTIIFWEFENFIKKSQARIKTLTGCCGCIYSIRKDLYTPLPPDIISDLVEPLTVLRKGYKIAFEPAALAYEHTTESQNQEFNMRIRVITRGMNGLLYIRDLLNPIRHPYLSFQLVSHKVLRWFVPVFLVIVFIANLFLAQSSVFYLITLLVQIGFYILAVIGLVLGSKSVRLKVFTLPAYFCIVNTASVISMFRILRGKKSTTWEPVRN